MLYRFALAPTVAPVLSYTCTYTSVRVPGLKCMYWSPVTVAVKLNHCSPPAAIVPLAHVLTVDSGVAVVPGGKIDVVTPIWYVPLELLR